MSAATATPAAGAGANDDWYDVTITEDGAVYDLGGCGTEEPSMEQPCQLSNVSAEGGEVVFDPEIGDLAQGLLTRIGLRLLRRPQVEVQGLSLDGHGQGKRP